MVGGQTQQLFAHQYTSCTNRASRKEEDKYVKASYGHKVDQLEESAERHLIMPDCRHFAHEVVVPERLDALVVCRLAAYPAVFLSTVDIVGGAERHPGAAYTRRLASRSGSLRNGYLP